MEKREFQRTIIYLGLVGSVWETMGGSKQGTLQLWAYGSTVGSQGCNSHSHQLLFSVFLSKPGNWGTPRWNRFLPPAVRGTEQSGMSGSRWASRGLWESSCRSTCKEHWIGEFWRPQFPSSSYLTWLPWGSENMQWKGRGEARRMGGLWAGLGIISRWHVRMNKFMLIWTHLLMPLPALQRRGMYLETTPRGPRILIHVDCLSIFSIHPQWAAQISKIPRPHLGISSTPSPCAQQWL